MPGLDGTGRNFAPLLDALAPDEEALVIRYPDQKAPRLGDLVEHVRAQLPARPFLLVAESFSGPVGLSLASASPPHGVGLVLVATFRRFPRRIPRWLASFAAPSLFAAPAPRGVLRRFLAGPDAPDAVVDGIRASIAANGPGVMAGRLRLLAEVDVGDALAQIRVPMLYLQGTEDRAVPSHNLDDLLALRPDIAVARIASAHLVLQRAPDEALRRIRAWWRETAAHAVGPSPSQ